MKIKSMLSQHRRDFVALFECETCGAIEEKRGYDDTYFHAEVIPEMPCKTCGAKAPPEYIPRPTRYPDGQQV